MTTATFYVVRTLTDFKCNMNNPHWSPYDFVAGKYVSSTSKMVKFSEAKLFVTEAKAKRYLKTTSKIMAGLEYFSIHPVYVSEPQISTGRTNVNENISKTS